MRIPPVLFAVFLGACARGAALEPTLAPAAPVLLDEGGGRATVADVVARAPLSVLVFFSSDCPVQKAHDARLRELVDTYSPRGVSFAAVVSEVSANLATEREEAKRRGLAIPVLADENAALADALGVEYSTHAILFDRERHVLYSGALDSERTHLTGSATRYLADAIDASLRGRPVARANTEPLGCPLRKH